MTEHQITDLDAFFERMRRGQEYDQEHRAEPQKTLTWGSKWIRFMPDHGLGGTPDTTLVVFGDVTTREQMVEDELREGSPEEEIEYLIAHRDRQMINGFLASMCYSVVLIGGEMGTVHQAWVWPISDATFEAAKVVEWDANQLPEEAAAEVLTAFQGFVAHQAHLALSDE